MPESAESEVVLVKDGNPIEQADCPYWLQQAVDIGTVTYHDDSVQPYLQVHTLQGQREARKGDWLARLDNGAIQVITAQESKPA